MSALSRVCQACGLCCSGAFLSHVQLRSGEPERLASLGVAVKKRKTGLPVLALGCSALKGTCCSIYEQRPRGCALYICAIGQKLEDGSMSEAEAMQLVDQAKALINAVEQHLPPSSEVDLRGVMHRARTEGLLSGPQPLRDAEDFLVKHFHKPQL